MPETPVRVQRRRSKGWRMPLNATYVGRPSIWGNPFYVFEGLHHDRWDVEWQGKTLSCWPTKPEAQAEAVRLFEKWFDKSIAEIGTELHDFRNRFGWQGFTLACMVEKLLRGKTLVCWCGSDVACHADVLLRLANQPKE